jgi:hypothetical protein
VPADVLEVHVDPVRGRGGELVREVAGPVVDRLVEAIQAVCVWGIPHRFECPRTDTHLTYMINITLTTEFVLPPRGAW